MAYHNTYSSCTVKGEFAMLQEHDTLFTIGEFAALHEINKKTLMWYDEIGLLKPVCTRENGYRCYSYQQSATLEIILMLRELDMSLEEIRQFLNNRSPETFDNLLTEKIDQLNQTISHLKAVQKVLQNHRRDLHTLATLDLNAITLVHRPSRYLAAVEIQEGLTSEEEISRVVAKTKQYQLRRLHDASYGAMLPVEHLYQGKMDAYSALYIEMPFPASKKGLHLQPAGTYLRAFCQGSWDHLPQRYQQILDYAQENGLELTGYAYETGINELVIHNVEDYITQIDIPVVEK